ncbi:MAG: class I SAM-dependent methyltransferase [Dehalococcoidia bacterium]
MTIDTVEGLGVVYERLILNDLLERIDSRYPYESVLEAPVYGMAGVDGINSISLAQKGKQVTLLDVDRGRLAGIGTLWDQLGLPVQLVFTPDPRSLPFSSRSVDLVWNFAALWHVLGGAGELVREMVRVSRDLVFIAMPNRAQLGYLLRKYAIDKEFFDKVDERWVSIARIKRTLREAGCRIVEEGVLDVPPWPDTCMPASEFLRRLGLGALPVRSKFEGEGWKWSTMDYYAGEAPGVRATVDKLAVLDRAPLPWQIKTVWAHHHYVLARRER